MNFMNIAATIHVLSLDDVETRLRKIGVPGVSEWRVEGFAQYKDFFQRDLMTTHARIQIYAPEDRVKTIVEAIVDAAHTGHESDGVVVVSPVAQMFRISEKRQIVPEDFK